MITFGVRNAFRGTEIPRRKTRIFTKPLRFELVSLYARAFRENETDTPVGEFTYRCLICEHGFVSNTFFDLHEVHRAERFAESLRLTPIKSLSIVNFVLSIKEFRTFSREFFLYGTFFFFFSRFLFFCISSDFTAFLSKRRVSLFRSRKSLCGSRKRGRNVATEVNGSVVEIVRGIRTHLFRFAPNSCGKRPERTCVRVSLELLFPTESPRKPRNTLAQMTANRQCDACVKPPRKTV